MLDALEPRSSIRPRPGYSNSPAHGTGAPPAAGPAFESLLLNAAGVDRHSARQLDRFSGIIINRSKGSRKTIESLQPTGKMFVDAVVVGAAETRLSGAG